MITRVQGVLRQTDRIKLKEKEPLQHRNRSIRATKTMERWNRKERVPAKRRDRSGDVVSKLIPWMHVMTTYVHDISVVTLPLSLSAFIQKYRALEMRASGPTL